MTTPQDDGGAAFPHQGQSGRRVTVLQLRDWFAGLALQAIVRKQKARRGAIDADHGELECARGAYCYADAMLAARKEDA